MALRLGKRRVLIAAVILGGLTAIYLSTHRRHESVEKCLSAFHADPCQKTADTLMDLLDEDDVTQEQATEILKALFQPKVVVEDYYITKRDIQIRIERKNPITLKEKICMFGPTSATLFIDGITGQDGVEEPENLDIDPKLTEHTVHFEGNGFPLGSPDQPDVPLSGNPWDDPLIRIRKAGTYKGKVRLSYDTELFVVPPTPSILERILTKLDMSKSPPQTDTILTFKYSYEIPFQIRVVAPKPTSPGDVGLPPAR